MTDHQPPRSPDLEQVLKQMGGVGARLAEMRACEGTAGNMSVCLASADPLPHFPERQPFELPETFPELAGKSLLVTGSGCRLRDLETEPLTNLGFVHVGRDGRSAQLYTSPAAHFARLTSELHSHLVLHQRAFSDAATSFHAVVHAQPMHLTYLTNIQRYQGGRQLADAILRWQPELTVIFPLGFGYVPFYSPNSDELMQATREVDPVHRLLVWEKHGVLAVSDEDAYKAFDLIEYVETGARYEYMNLLTREQGEGLLPEEIQAIRDHFHLPAPAHDPTR
jgi:rhamnulose-1-phosphate aldolase